MGKRKYLKEEIEAKIFELEKGKYEMIGEYINTSTPFLMRYHISQDEWVDYYTTADNFINRGRRYKKHAKVIRWNTELVRERIRQDRGDEYSLIGDYINTNRRVKIRHNCDKCNNYEFEVDWSHFSSHKTGCPYCNVGKQHNDIVSEILGIAKEEYSLLSKCERNTKKALFRHNSERCGNHEFYMRPYSFIYGSRCPKCAVLNRKSSLEDVKNEIINITSGEYIMIGDEYVSCKEKIKLLHVDCGMEFYMSRNDFVYRSRRCPYCSVSKGENIIKEYLVKNNVDFEIQKKFDDLFGTGGGKLSYDFYLPKHNILIEFQGRQHYIPIDRFGGQDQLEKQRIHDELKMEYAKNNKIELLEIPHWEFDNIENILLEKLSKEVIKIE